jgi:2',3'-cyclic-nucleotide 2'-phosphodiesterase (5'-nucleotidase family)
LNCSGFLDNRIPYLFLEKGEMQMNRLKWRAFILLLTLTVIIAGFQNPAGAGFRDPINVTILFFNDVHGHLSPFKIRTDAGKKEVGGVARLATLIETIREENRIKNIQTFVLIAGDILQGTPMSTVFRGQPDVECFNAMGVHAMTVGNHEFDFGLQNFLDLKQKARFPFLSSNIVVRDTGNLLCAPYAALKLTDRVSLSIIGVTTKLLLTTTRTENVQTVDVLDPVQSVTRVFEAVKDRGPVILLSHSKHKTDRAIATAVPDLAAVIGGHDQILLSPYRKVGEVPVFQAFEKGKFLGRIDLQIDPLSKKALLVSNRYLPVTADIKADPRIERIIDAYRAKLESRFLEVLGESKVFLDAERDRIRYEETNLGNWVADLVREASGARIALINGGSLRASIDEGPITLEDVYKTMPYANEIVVIELTGAELMQALTRSVSGSREDEDGGFLHVSGIRFEVRAKKVENLAVGDRQEPLDADHTYRVAITDFLSSGGDGYSIFSGKHAEYTGLPLRELIADTIRARKVIESRIDGRIGRVGE